MGESLSFFKEAFRLEEVDAGMYSPLVLAYVGDAVYEIMIRTKVVNGGSVQVNKLHKLRLWSRRKRRQRWLWLLWKN